MLGSALARGKSAEWFLASLRHTRRVSGSARLTLGHGSKEGIDSFLRSAETNFFEKNVRFELAFSEMSARLNIMPDAGVAQW